MTTEFKVLDQATPVAAVLTNAYEVPAGKQAVCSSIVVCNRDAGVATFRLAVAVAGAVDHVKQYVAFNSPLVGNDSIALTIGMTLGETDVVRVYASTEFLSFSIFGEEITP